MNASAVSTSGRILIGIDASRSVALQPTGTELYSRYLIEALRSRAPDRFFFRLYFNQPPKSAISHQPSAISRQPSAVRIIPFPRLWTHLRLSVEMLVHRPDLLFVPAHVLPIIHPRRSVVTVHDLGYLYFPEAHPPRQRWYLDRSTRWHARTAAHLLTDSAATQRDLVEKYHAAPDKITVAYPGLDPSLKRVDDPAELARVRSKYHIDGDYLLYLGTIQPRKNLQRLIEAFSQLPTASGQLLLAGKPGWYSEQLLQQAHDRIKFIGYVDAADKNALLSGATAFVFPSLYEGFGFPVLEALACGVPVLCSNTSSLPEVAGDTAVLVNPLDVDDIARGLHDITTNEDLRHTLIERGYPQAQKFTWQACANVVLKVFEEVLEPERVKG
ncbi:mannosyl-N-acetyl-alpha-D-glucosaminyl-diphospho-ditrans,octacis-undecaprenol 3-alpha-mannosyltransferase / alpha-1,3-rhamnosyltransferase [Thermoflexales bacterium]|nr:mannosyl-N-acetyl-alpha-D-glucosaminyl-diphospho-ditrans,octacis-undecaprenol 3-alpha-mannosyltransferase / alpha-1,3-rhamnosyltransferase [Thermoflexales bacterium]